MLEKYFVEDRPPFLGLVQSNDGGESWDIVDLLGDADFHALAPRADGLFAAEAGGSIWFLDSGGLWAQLGEVDARDLAVADEAGSIRAAEVPEGPWTEVATGPAEVETIYVDDAGWWWVAVHGGAISRSEDQGESWLDVYVPPSAP